MNELDFADAIIEEAEIDFEPFYNQHFIEVDEQNRIVKGWSDAFAPATENSIVINEQGGYQFRLFPDGEENPSLYTWDMVPLYKWDGEQGAAGYPYHLDGQLCAVFLAADIRQLAQAAARHKLYHTTYYNHLAAWVRRSKTTEEVQAITYGTELPEDLAANMANILGGVETENEEL